MHQMQHSLTKMIKKQTKKMNQENSRAKKQIDTLHLKSDENQNFIRKQFKEIRKLLKPEENDSSDNEDDKNKDKDKKK